MRLLATLTLFTSLIPLACGGNGTATGSTCPSNSTLTYQNFGQAFMQEHCTTCHSRGVQSPDLSTQMAVQENADLIDKQAASGPNATNTAMPQGASIATADRAKLGEWLACGAR